MVEGNYILVRPVQKLVPIERNLAPENVVRSQGGEVAPHVLKGMGVDDNDH